MIDLLLGLLRFIVVLSICAVAMVVWDKSVPARQWFRQETRGLLRRAAEPVARRRQAWVTGHAMRRVGSAVVHLGPAIPGVPTRGWFAVIQAVKTWSSFMPLAVIAQLVKLAALVMALLNVGTIVAGVRFVIEHPPGSEHSPHPNCVASDKAAQADAHGTHSAKGCPELVDPLAALWHAGRDAVAWVRASVGPVLADPGADLSDTAKIFTTLALLVMLGVAMRIAVPLIRRANDTAERRPGLRNTALQQPRGAVPKTVRGGETARWQPVVVLLVVCRNVGLANKQLGFRDVLHAPRVSLKAAERVVWNAWRTRHGRVRWARRADFKTHAAKVVAALRTMEARQDSAPDTGKVFEDTAVMLLKIAQRYAEGHTLALLDAEELEGVAPVQSREWIRLLAFGVIVTGTVTGALIVGLPEAAATPLIGVVTLVAWSVLYGGRMVGADLVDVMRGQSRS
ncbi:hypothetical protein [Streptomyces sp. NBC_01361]|uniref:hypothetical protein n=1 Tax=Streptomyces sp. NBC_01361 TaxID=2903838 RepID=UPI002E3164FB|nr:hypothetical protein [Streptomyces sp. NBC_01361]